MILLAEEDIDIALIQEPWFRFPSIRGLGNRNYNLFYMPVEQNSGIPRTCILVKKHINAFLCPNYSSKDLTTVKLVDKKGEEIYISSTYMGHDRPMPPPEFAGFITTTTSKRETVLAGCDANARHTLWGSSEVNDKGEQLFEFIINTNLELCNRGDTPTFTFPSSDRHAGWEDVLDITLTNDPKKLLKVEQWRVSPKRSFSDHSWILFTIGVASDPPPPNRSETQSVPTGTTSVASSRTS